MRTARLSARRSSKPETRSRRCTHESIEARLAGCLRRGWRGIDCLGCCAGLMIALVALGMMNLALVFTAALIIFAEKTLPDSHRIAPTLGFVMIVGGVAFFGFSLLGGMQAEMKPAVGEPGMPAIEDSTETMEEPGMESM